MGPWIDGLHWPSSSVMSPRPCDVCIASGLYRWRIVAISVGLDLYSSAYQQYVSSEVHAGHRVEAAEAVIDDGGRV